MKLIVWLVICYIKHVFYKYIPFMKPLKSSYYKHFRMYLRYRQESNLEIRYFQRQNEGKPIRYICKNRLRKAIYQTRHNNESTGKICRTMSVTIFRTRSLHLIVTGHKSVGGLLKYSKQSILFRTIKQITSEWLIYKLIHDDRSRDLANYCSASMSKPRTVIDRPITERDDNQKIPVWSAKIFIPSTIAVKMTHLNCIAKNKRRANDLITNSPKHTGQTVRTLVTIKPENCGKVLKGDFQKQIDFLWSI